MLTIQGCNIPDIDIVVQWKLTTSVSAFVQRAGRAARAAGRTGLAVLLVEKSAYDTDLLAHFDSLGLNSDVAGSKEGKKRKRGVREAVTYPKASNKEYAVSRGVQRGGPDPTKDATGNRDDIPVDMLALDEGLYTLVQTGKCRRLVLTRVYRNAPAGKHSVVFTFKRG